MASRKKHGPQQAVVQWLDAHSTESQVYDLETINHTPLRVETLGWVAKQDATGVTLFAERIDNGDGSSSWRGHTFVPAGMVISVTPVRALVPRKKRDPSVPNDLGPPLPFPEPGRDNA